MTAAAERQRELDKQIKAFLANGGQIRAFDTLRRPVEPTSWAQFSLKGSNPPLPKPPCEAGSAAPAAPSSTAPAAQTAVAAAKPRRVRRRRSIPADDERLAVKIIVAAALGGSPRVIASELHIPLSRCLAIAEHCHVQFHG